jgi:hypothetical protein
MLNICHRRRVRIILQVVLAGGHLHGRCLMPIWHLKPSHVSNRRQSGMTGIKPEMGTMLAHLHTTTALATTESMGNGEMKRPLTGGRGKPNRDASNRFDSEKRRNESRWKKMSAGDAESDDKAICSSPTAVASLARRRQRRRSGRKKNKCLPKRRKE